MFIVVGIRRQDHAAQGQLERRISNVYASSARSKRSNSKSGALLLGSSRLRPSLTAKTVVCRKRHAVRPTGAAPQSQHVACAGVADVDAAI